MIRAIAGGLLVAATMSTAMAADLIVDEPVYEAAMAAAHDWSGVYVGIQGGYGWGTATIDDGLLIVDEAFDISGWFAGGSVSALAQFDAVVVGVEAQANYSTISGDAEVLPPAGNMVNAQVDWFGSLDAKVGVAADNALIYATGGFAVASIATGQAVPVPSFSTAQTVYGWTAGAGVDFAATDNLVVGVQYRYYDFGSVNYVPPAPFSARSQAINFHTVAAKLAYKF